MSSAPAPRIVEAGWVRLRAISYLRGRGVSFGLGGPEPIYPLKANDLGKYSLNFDLIPGPATAAIDGNLAVIAKGSLDHVFVGDRIQHFKDPENFIKDSSERLREGGHIVVHMLGQQQERVEAWLRTCGYWRTKATYFRADQFLGIYKLLGKQRRGVEPAKALSGAKRACICRYGAIGDMIMISPLIKQLHADGYEVTMNITPYCAEVLKNNPYVHNIVLQERDAIPNAELGPYWNEWKDDYDKYINLSESIEGKLLKVEGRRDFYTTKTWREDLFGSTNYYDQTMRLGGYGAIKGTRGELHFSSAEEKQARLLRAKFKDKFLILWSLKGSSHHKVYPRLRETLDAWLEGCPDAQILLTGTEQDKGLGFDRIGVLNTAGQLQIRDVFCLTKHVDLVVGPESAIINAAGCWDTPKIVLLSHSSEENLCKYWSNYQALAPTSACYPCHQLHYNLESCPLKMVGTAPLPVCAADGISPERLQAALTVAYGNWKARPVPAT